MQISKAVQGQSLWQQTDLRDRFRNERHKHEIAGALSWLLYQAQLQSWALTKGGAQEPGKLIHKQDGRRGSEELPNRAADGRPPFFLQKVCACLLLPDGPKVAGS